MLLLHCSDNDEEPVDDYELEHAEPASAIIEQMVIKPCRAYVQQRCQADARLRGKRQDSIVVSNIAGYSTAHPVSFFFISN